MRYNPLEEAKGVLNAIPGRVLREILVEGRYRCQKDDGIRTFEVGNPCWTLETVINIGEIMVENQQQRAPATWIHLGLQFAIIHVSLSSWLESQIEWSQPRPSSVERIGYPRPTAAIRGRIFDLNLGGTWVQV